MSATFVGYAPSTAFFKRVASITKEKQSKRVEDRQMFTAIVYVLRTGIQWNALPRELRASSTVYDRFVRWEKLGETYQAFLQLACGLICFHYTSHM